MHLCAPSRFSLILLLTVTVFLTGRPAPLTAGNKGVNREKYRIAVARTAGDIKIDGISDEPAWLAAARATHFQRVLPTDTGFAIAQTEVRLLYNKTTLFVSITCLDPNPGKRPVESLRRDFNFQKNDNFVVFIDTYNDQTNGFAFGVNSSGAQWDGVQANGASVNLDWDIKWQSAVKNYADRWTAEFAIPFRSVRYNGGAAEWGINFSRNDLKSAEKSSWAPMPRQFATATLAYTGSLVWEEPLPSSGPRFSLIPFATARASQNNVAGTPMKPDASAGIDAKVILSTSMNLDLTVNPDYSQVEVDKQQTNLDRFELFFPEKRQFYLENSDLFANLGTDNLRPFFSRRIGLREPVIAGARLSGKIGSNWRLGLMDVQTGARDTLPAANYAVAAIQRKVLRRSNVSAFLVNRELLTGKESEGFTGNLHNRVAGAEFNLASADNRWTGKTFLHHSFNPGGSGNSSVMAANLTYSTQYITATLNQSWVGAGYLAEVGYIRRKGYYEIAPLFQYKFYPKDSRVANHGPGFKADLYFDPRLSFTDRDIQLFYQVEWLNKSILMADVRDAYVRLLTPFDPTNLGGVPLAAGDSFNWREAGIIYASDIRKPVNLLVSSRYGGYFNGTRFQAGGDFFFRVQPWASFALTTMYNDIRLPGPHNSARFLLIGPRLDLTFTDKLFLTGFVQYNNQADNLNVNLRFQWRFAPVSDLFIVYTENSYPGDGKVKNRGVVVKLSYWFN
jgi:hypothetical protein